MKDHRPLMRRRRHVLFAGFGLCVSGFALVGPIGEFSPNGMRAAAAPLSAASPGGRQTAVKLSPNDVSWLFPPPLVAADFAKAISMGDLSVSVPGDAARRERAWPDAAFDQLLAIAGSPAAAVSGTPARIGLPTEARSISAWHIAGVRIDAGAPGLSDAIRTEFGRLPQIRLIVQPVFKDAQGRPTRSGHRGPPRLLVHRRGGSAGAGWLPAAPEAGSRRIRRDRARNGWLSGLVLPRAVSGRAASTPPRSRWVSIRAFAMRRLPFGRAQR